MSSNKITTNRLKRVGTVLSPARSGDSLDMGSQLITSVADPVSPTDVVNLQTLESAIPGGFEYYLSNSASADVAGYKLLATTNDPGASTVTADGTSASQALDEWVTLAGTPGDITISEGNFSCHFYASVARTNSVDFQYAIKVQFYKRASGGAEVQLGSDITSVPVLSTSSTLYSVHAHLTEPQTLIAGDRIVVKLTTVRTGTAPRVTAQIVTLNLGDVTPSHMSVPVTLAILGKYLPLAGGTMTGALEAADHGTASTDQVVNIAYGTGAAPTANTTTIGSLYITYTA